MSKFANIVAVAVCGLTIAASAFAADAPTAKTVLATVDGTDITLGHVISFRNRLPKQYKALADDVLFQGIVQQLIQQTVLMNAEKKKMSHSALLGFENVKRSFLASEMLAGISGRAVSEAALKAAYLERYDAAVPEQEYRASHILVKTREEADTIEKLLDDGADFSKLAREKSTGPSASNGGDLGWFGAKGMVKQFSDAVMKLAIGERSAPVQTKFGWHVIKLTDMRNLTIPTLDDVRDKMSGELRRQATQAEIKRLTDAADVVQVTVDIDPAVIRDVSLLNK